MSHSDVVKAFRRFSSADDFNDVIKSFDELKQLLHTSKDTHGIYNALKQGVSCAEAQKFFKLLDARQGADIYGNGSVCQGKTILVIGGGPCGLRAAVECALLGARVSLVEMRNYATRNNILHLWPSAANDLKAIGAKVFYPKFCSGAIHHVSIRRLQLILMKIAVMLGVHIFCPATFTDLLQPDQHSGAGWRASVTPQECPINNLDIDVVIGADGKCNSLGFPRKFTRGKVSIAITANFNNPGVGLHTHVSEIPGVISIKHPELFSALKEKTGLEFENFVYFRDETHYFIMTVRKKSIINKGLVKRETADLRAMFQPDNINREALLTTVRQIAETAWQVDNPSLHELPKLDFQQDYHGHEDVAMFDFAALHQAEYSCLIKERYNKKILQIIVGDTLLEPFWPSGSGIAKGFLGVLDTAWTIRNWALGTMSDIEIIAEREGIYRVLPQVTPDNLNKDIGTTTINPHTRYMVDHYGARIPLDTVRPMDVGHLYNTVDKVELTMDSKTINKVPLAKKQLYRGGSIDTHRLICWFKERLQTFSHIFQVTDLAKSWNTGLALCALIQSVRPDLMEVTDLDRTDACGNIEKAFQILENEFGIEQMMAPEDLAGRDNPDRLTMMSYLFHIYEYIIAKEEPTVSENRASDSLISSGTHSSPHALVSAMERDHTQIHDTSMDKMSCKASKTMDAKCLKYFLQVTSLNRHDKRKLHMAVHRHLTMKPEQSAPGKFRHMSKLPVQRQKHKNNSFDEKVDMIVQNSRASTISNSKAEILSSSESFTCSRDTLPIKKKTGEICCICNNKLYIVQRYCAYGYFLHRQCFKCTTCGTSLRIGYNVVIPDENNSPHFYCYVHAYQAGLQDVKWVAPDDLSRKSAVSYEQLIGEFSTPLTAEELKYFDSAEDSDTESLDGTHTDMAGKEINQSVISDTATGGQGGVMSDTATGGQDSVMSDTATGGQDSVMSDTTTGGQDSVMSDTTTGGQDSVMSDMVDDTQMSMTLMEQEEIQEGLDELEHARDELEQRGIILEQELRNLSGNRLSAVEEEYLNAWLNIAQEKQLLNNKEAKLMLKFRLMNLQERLAVMLEMMTCLNDDGDPQLIAEMHGLEEENEALEDDVNQMIDEMQQISLRLARTVP